VIANEWFYVSELYCVNCSDVLRSIHITHLISSDLITDLVSTRGNAVASIHLFLLLFFELTVFDLDLLHVCGSLPWLAGIETER